MDKAAKTKQEAIKNRVAGCMTVYSDFADSILEPAKWLVSLAGKALIKKKHNKDVATLSTGSVAKPPKIALSSSGLPVALKRTVNMSAPTSVAP